MAGLHSITVGKYFDVLDQTRLRPHRTSLDHRGDKLLRNLFAFLERKSNVFGKFPFFSFSFLVFSNLEAGLR